MSLDHKGHLRTVLVAAVVAVATTIVLRSTTGAPAQAAHALGNDSTSQAATEAPKATNAASGNAKREAMDDSQRTAMDDAQRTALIAATLQFADRARAKAWPDPPILALSEDAFAREVCRDDIPCQNIAAAYDAKRRRVLYRARLDMALHWDRSFVVHEIVHWLQHQARPEGVDDDESCRAYKMAEVEAYTVQNRYLHFHQSGRRAGGFLNMLMC